ncbi:MAG: ribose 5-phosphate isomerase B [Chloroflexi bacterium]|nr:ribose 5-phosphate isomerase B [Chloroflexota bacterium]
MIVAVGCDHNGLTIKDAVRRELEARGITVRDLTPPLPANGVDYPDVAADVARAVAAGDADRGVLVCGTGQGMSIAANKVPGIRAAVCSEPYSARMSREDNDANVLCMGGRTIGLGAALEILNVWLNVTPSSEDRHVRRRGKIATLEEHRP